MMNLHKAATAAMFAVVSLMTGHAAAVPIYSENFNGYGSGHLGTTQTGTGLGIKGYGDLPNWTKTGTNALHAVQRGVGDWAIMIFDADSIMMNSGIAANAAGTSYTVSFDAAAAAYRDPLQGTAAGDKLVIQMLNPLNAVVASFEYATPVWTNQAVNPFVDASFTYIGDGTGNVRLRVADNLTHNNRFGGAIDNLVISAIPAAVPEPATALLLLGGLCGVAVTRRRNALRS